MRKKNKEEESTDRKHFKAIHSWLIRYTKDVKIQWEKVRKDG